MGANVAKGRGWAAFRQVAAPFVVGAVEEPVLEIMAMEQVQPAEQTVADHGACLLHHWIVAVLIVDSVDPIPLCGKGSKRSSVACGRRERLLAPDVLAPVHFQFCQSRVSLVRCTDVDGVY